AELVNGTKASHGQITRLDVTRFFVDADGHEFVSHELAQRFLNSVTGLLYVDDCHFGFYHVADYNTPGSTPH
ncbi:MAG: hypothetical protein ACRC47_17210, partial [Shewanella sp.]